MSADRARADESGKAPASREPTGGAEDETQTMGTGTQGAKIASPPDKGGSDSARKEKDKQVSGSGKAPLSPPPPVDSSRRAGDAAGNTEKNHVEKMAPAPASLPRVSYLSSSMSRKKRKQKVKRAAAAAAAAAAGTIEDTIPLETDHGGTTDDGFPGLYEIMRWRQLDHYRRVGSFQNFPVEPSPEQLVSDLCETYVKTIDLTMEKRYKNINFNRWMTVILSLISLSPVFDFIYYHIFENDLYVIDYWKKDIKHVSPFMYPLVLHFFTWPLITVPLVFAHRNFRIYSIATNAYLVPLFSILVATALILYEPCSDNFKMMVEYAIDGVMHKVRHLEDGSTQATRQKIAGVYIYVAAWAVAHSLLCCLCFYMSVRTLSALRYYQKYSFEADHPAHTVEHVERSALVGQSTKRVPLTNYRNIADTRGSRTPRTPHSRTSIPNSPASATAVAESTPLL